MGILIKLCVLVAAVIIAFQLLVALIPAAIVITFIAGIAVALANAALCGFRDGNAGAAWQGACSGFGGTCKVGVGVLKTITRMVFGFVKGLA